MKIVWHTKEAERIIGIAMRRCYTTKPIELIEEEVTPEYGAYLSASAYQRMEFDVYEHVRITVLADLSADDLLSLLLKYRYLDATPLTKESWLISFNLRTAVEAAMSGDTEFQKITESVAPTISNCIKGQSPPPRPTPPEVKQSVQVSQEPKVVILQAFTPLDLKRALLNYGLELSAQGDELARHCFVTFAIEGISRVCSHQLVRHRPVSFSQESQRFSAAVEEDFIMPDTISMNQSAKELTLRLFRQAKECYARLRELGIKKEDARFVLPMAISTKLLMTVQIKYLKHILFYRSSVTSIGLKAQWEIRRLSDKMLSLMKQIMPDLFSQLAP
jgi:thymidylate synthase (FAD)